MSQTRSSRGGRVLRINPANAAPAAGVPFGNSVSTFGHRNVQGLALRPGTDQMYAVEHGPDRDDEVNLMRGGANYGWDPEAPPDPYNESVPMTDTRKFPDAVPAVGRPGSPPIPPAGAPVLVRA